MTTGQWARLRPAEAAHLRRGAWYRVLRLTPLEAVLDVNGTQTTFPRPSLEILPTPPTRWTVVPRPARPPRLPPPGGARSPVCPNSPGRAPPQSRAPRMALPNGNAICSLG